MQKSQDKLLRCVDCNENFVFTEGEQKFYKDKNFSEPKRCSDCRKNRKLKRYE